MKKNIHPKWYKKAQVICACGQMFTVGSTLPEINVEVCSKCHPFFTGEARYVDTMGRAERFQKRQATASQHKKKKLKKKAEETEKQQPKTLREMLMELKKK